MSRLARCFAAAAVLLLTGCASSGRQFDTAHVNEIQNGKQDKATIAAWFGEPGQKQPVSGSPAGCTERWLWTYAHAVGFGKVTEAHSLVVDFDTKGLVCDHAYTKQQ